MNKLIFLFIFFLLFSVGAVVESAVVESNSNTLICGDVTEDGLVNILDAVYLINFLYKDGPPPAHIGIGNVNYDAYTNIFDIVYLINYLYKDGPVPNCLTIQPIILQPENEQTLTNPIYVAVENQGIADFSEVHAVKIYYSTDNADWVYLETVGPSTENLWEFSIELNPGFNYIMVIMETAEEGRSSPSVLIEVV